MYFSSTQTCRILTGKQKTLKIKESDYKPLRANVNIHSKTMNSHTKKHKRLKNFNVIIFKISIEIFARIESINPEQDSDGRRNGKVK